MPAQPLLPTFSSTSDMPGRNKTKQIPKCAELVCAGTSMRIIFSNPAASKLPWLLHRAPLRVMPSKSAAVTWMWGLKFCRCGRPVILSDIMRRCAMSKHPAVSREICQAKSTGHRLATLIRKDHHNPLQVVSFQK